ncbi:FHA domain-containing protein [Salinibacterium sp. UTAS2018]|uniref:FHA domain-containing protein n=1 Tax=unclassified Salinibacterium TaxID=2632331 RepID=UPI0010095281|nr:MULTISPECIES: FHA domain-containing protein [unclassified Salinibacterium]MBH0010316.1 FHA domain-containing protein [Salinibacterium sp. SWN1162]QAV69098.1 FHA domain-containing protein [Salinibacterium sp. UTAS2018]
MKHDVEDTITSGQRPPVQPTMPDLDDTIIISARRKSAIVRPYKRPDESQAKQASPTTAQEAARLRARAAAQVKPPQAPVAESTEPSALYYRVQLDGTEQAYSLEHACVFGRDPRPPRIVKGVGPRLIAVQSPQREVSETHVEVRQLGSSVIVTDLRSTNGSVAQVPGNAARKLRQGESVVVSTGTLVDIGDGNIIRILPRRRLE